MPEELKNKVIVVVDDDPFIVEVITDYFAKNNTVYGYESAELAQQVIPNLGPIDLFIVDYILPGINGVELFHDLHPKHPESKFICISGEMSFEMAQQGHELGFDALLLKPFDLALLEKNALQMVSTR